MTNITEVNFQDKDNIEAMLLAFERDMGKYIKYQKLMASYRRAIYEAYLEQGFTEEQALQLTATVTGTV